MHDLINRLKRKRILFPVAISLILLIAALFFCEYISKNENPKPTKGVLNLSQWNLNKGKPSLAGEWEFYWNQLYTYSDFMSGRETNEQYVYVPQTWNSYKNHGKSLPAYGYATYRLKVKVDDPSRQLSLRIDTMSTAYRLFINDKEIAANGKVGINETSSKPGYRPNIVDFQPPDNTFDIIVQVSNFTYARGGIWYEINLGTHEQIEALNKITVYKDAILIGSLLIMALYYASFYIVLQRDKSSLYFMLLCMIFIIRTSLYGDVMIVNLFSNIPYKLIIFLTYATLYWIPVILFLLVDSIYENTFVFNIRKAFILYGLVATIITAFLPISTYTALVSLVELIGIGIVILSVGIIVKAYLGHENGAGLILLTVFSILLAGIHDVLYQANVIHHVYGEMASIGIFFFVLSFSFIIARRLSNAYEREKNLTIQLGESLEKEKKATDEMIKSDLAFLKAQIKPHFLYNSLSVITALSTKDPQRTKKLLYDLSDYLRGSFNFENYNGITPIEGEIATIKAYLSIEKERFQGKLNVVYDIDETIEQSIPLLTIQPLVENALRHGILKKSEGGTVWISIQKGDACTVVNVRDNGVGMSQDKIEDIFSGTGTVTGVGLKNIHRRLLLHYGRGLEITSHEGQGTTVTITIPEYEENDKC